MKSIAPFKTGIRQLENLLQKVTTTPDTTQRCDYAQQINKYRSTAETTLLEFQAKYKDDLTSKETEALGAPLAYTAFNINMIFMEPYTKKLDTKYELSDLVGRISERIYITEQCLATMTSPAQSKFQEYTHGEYIKRIMELTSEAFTDLR